MNKLQLALEDPDLDYNCKGILCYLAFVADNATSFTNELERVSKSSSVTIKKSMSILENKGYVRRRFDETSNRVLYQFLQKKTSLQNRKKTSLQNQ